MQRTESICVCQECGHPREVHQADQSGAVGALRLRTKCGAHGCTCSFYSGELWRKESARVPELVQAR